MGIDQERQGSRIGFDVLKMTDLLKARKDRGQGSRSDMNDMAIWT
jgi:hypothetical protein